MIFNILYFFIFAKSIILNLNGEKYNGIEVNGEKRKYLLYYPESLRKIQNHTKLWVLFHGSPSNAKRSFHTTDFFLLAEDKQFILLVPQGRCMLNIFCFWETGLMRSPLDTNWDKDDIEYIDMVIENFFEFSKLDKNSSQIVITGYSGGAFMAYTYAINTTKHKIHTVIGIAGHVGGKSHPLDKPVRIYDPNKFGIQGNYLPNVIMIFGGNDKIIRIEGGNFIYGMMDFSLDQDIEFWLRENNCINSTEEHNYDMNGELKLTFYGKCLCEKKIISVIAKNINHIWKKYDELFQNTFLKKKNFSLYSKTLAEFLYNLVEYEIVGKLRPYFDPDPNIPSDKYYPKWFDFSPIYKNSGKNNAYYSLSEVIFVVAGVSILIFLYMYGILMIFFCKFVRKKTKYVPTNTV